MYLLLLPRLASLRRGYLRLQKVQYERSMNRLYFNHKNIRDDTATQGYLETRASLVFCGIFIDRNFLATLLASAGYLPVN